MCSRWVNRLALATDSQIWGIALIGLGVAGFARLIERWAGLESAAAIDILGKSAVTVFVICGAMALARSATRRHRPQGLDPRVGGAGIGAFIAAILLCAWPGDIRTFRTADWILLGACVAIASAALVVLAAPRFRREARGPLH